MSVQMGDLMWEASASRKQQSNMYSFSQFASKKCQKNFSDWPSLYQWSIEDTESFWSCVNEFTQIKWNQKPENTYRPPEKGKMLGAKWFEQGTLSFAENLLSHPPEKEALVCYQEHIKTASYTYGQLFDKVKKCAFALKKSGILQGDHVAGVLINGAEAIIAMLATNMVGAIWCSCSPDFGAEGITDRISQVSPKVIFFSQSYLYNQKQYDCSETIRSCRNHFPESCQFVLCQVTDTPVSQSMGFEEFLQSSGDESVETFTYTPFDHPLYVMFSSGTTGKPKAIVHGVGGTLLQHKKELSLHSDLGNADTLLYYTTCGWMMWNWMVSALSVGCRVITYDGSPARPSVLDFWSLIEREQITALGTSPKFISTCMAKDLNPSRSLSFDSLKTIFSTGSPLLPEHYEWIYQNVRDDVHLASISGGTDIISCFMLGNPLLPVTAGEIQGPGLGMKIHSYDQDACPVTEQKGELVCSLPFVSMPVRFLHDPDMKKYKKAYFEHYDSEEVWHHGDFIKISGSGSIVIYGRSDATLNPGGVRIGTSEIYRQVEQLPFTEDSIAIGHRLNGDTEVLLFVKLSPDLDIPENWQNLIRDRIRTHLTPRHVPSKIIPIKDIPYTRSGKKVEIAVTRILHGEEADNKSALANPDSLKDFTTISAHLSNYS